jgi:thioredoxin 1
MYTKVTDRNFKKEVLESEQPVMVEFKTNWSGACCIIAPIIAQLALDHGEKIKFAVLDSDCDRATPQKYNISDIPTILFFEHGILVDKITGVVSRQVLEGKIAALFQDI